MPRVPLTTCRPAPRPRRVVFFGLTLLALLGGCVAPDRPSSAGLPGIAQSRRWADDPVPPFQGVAGARRHTVLALSGGGPDGAFGVGVLRGWTALGTRPRFDVVTGVSTGALMAPFAFLGPDWDPLLTELYTGPHLDGLLAGGPTSLLLRPAFYAHAPLRALLERHVTPELLSLVAAEHRLGRRLLVATMNMDAQRRAVWDMGAIALPGDAAALALFRDILLAAVSLPVLFPPVLFPPVLVPPAAMAAGDRPAEMHADASTASGILVEPAMFPAHCGTHTLTCQVFVVVHNKLLPETTLVDWRATAIGMRTVDSMVKANLMLSLQAARAMAHQAGAHFAMAHLDAPWPGVSPVDFDRDYMRRILEFGALRVQGRGFWRDIPTLAAHAS
jgi:hypothetical protein